MLALALAFIRRERSFPDRFTKNYIGSGLSKPWRRKKNLISSRRMTWRTGFMVPLQQGHSIGKLWEIKGRL